MKIQGNVIPLKDCNSFNADFKYTKIGTKLDKNFKSLLVKMADNFKENTNK